MKLRTEIFVSALRFTESLHDLKIACWDHELPGKCSAGVLAWRPRLRVHQASRRVFVLAAGRRRNSQPRRLRYAVHGEALTSREKAGKFEPRYLGSYDRKSF